MGTYTAAEAAKFFRSYGAKCDENDVKEWMKRTISLSRSNQVDESDLHAFNDWLSSQGTAYEPSIDDETKIIRLLEEIKNLKEENAKLKEQIYILENKLEISPF